MSGEVVATMIKSMSNAPTPAISKADCAANIAKSLLVWFGLAMCRWVMPVRERIHSSDVSTPSLAKRAASSSLLTASLGK